MSPLFRIPLGILIMFIGFLVVLKTEKVYEWFGEVPFAEERLGTGMSRFFYKLVGVLLVFIGIFVSTNIISEIMGSVACVLTNCA